MKLKSVSIVLVDYDQSHHRQTAKWHEEIHRAEMHAHVPSFFFSQDLMAPPEYMKLRPPNNLPAQGGAYMLYYLSDIDAERMHQQTRDFSDDPRRKGKFSPTGREVAWRLRMDVVAAHARPNLQIELDALPMAPNSGLIIFIEEVIDAAKSREYERWLSDVHLPSLLTGELMDGCFELQPGAEGEENTRVRLYFTAQADPARVYSRGLQLTEQQRAAVPQLADARRDVFSGVYRPIVKDDITVVTVD